MNDPKILALGTRVLQADINSDTARQAGILPPYPGFTGIVAQALRPWPQYQGINWHTWPIGKSIYHSLQVKLDKRFASGMFFRIFYTRSKLLNNAADNGNSTAPSSGLQNPVDARPEWSTSVDDVPNTFVATWSYELPFGRNRKDDLLKKLIAGWTLTGILRYESARPLTVTMTNDMGGLLFNPAKRPNRVAGTPAVTPRGDTGAFDPNADRYLSSAAYTDPPAAVWKCAATRPARARIP
jgi:hypothetical protein